MAEARNLATITANEVVAKAQKDAQTTMGSIVSIAWCERPSAWAVECTLSAEPEDPSGRGISCSIIDVDVTADPHNEHSAKLTEEHCWYSPGS